MMTGMRNILAQTLALAMLGVFSQQVLAEPAEPVPEPFLIGTTDIPLMPGLTEDEAATVFFDKPAGRILIASPAGCVDRQEAQRYYGTALPQLGWLPGPQAESGAILELVYLREGERLTLEFFASGNDCAAMRFLLSPVPDAQ